VDRRVHLAAIDEGGAAEEERHHLGEGTWNDAFLDDHVVISHVRVGDTERSGNARTGRLAAGGPGPAGADAVGARPRVVGQPQEIAIAAEAYPDLTGQCELRAEPF